MVDFGIYLLESSLCLAGFYLAYRFFLSGDTFATRNRFYLLFSILSSLLIPLLHFSIAKENLLTANQFIWEFEEIIEKGINAPVTPQQPGITLNWNFFLPILYLSGVLIALIRMLKHLTRLVKLINANELRKKEDLKIVSVKENSSPYSFFRYVFINPDLISNSDQKQVLLHESIHAKQYHSLDLILVEMVKMLLWFNPFIYLIKRSLIEMHEYLADQECINKGIDKIEYQNALLRNVESQMILAFTSSFNSSLTLKRIKMIKKINSSRYAHLKLIAIIPVITLSVFCFGFVESKSVLLDGNFEGYYHSGEYEFPIKAGEKIYISSEYGERIHPIHKKKVFHKGIDIAAPKGTPIHSIADGVVQKVKHDFVLGKGHGRYIIVAHSNGISGLYSQMNSYSVKEGQTVKKGDILGTIGTSGISTGPHLHLEIKKDGKHVNPMNYFNIDLSEFKK